MDGTPSVLAQAGARKPNLLEEPLSRSSSPDSSSSSHARWDRIRQHVLRSPPNPHHPGHSQQSSSVSSITTLQPRPQTPKPSRLARLGLWHVVEQAREVGDMSRKFAEDVQKACWSSRYLDSARAYRFDREGVAGSMPYLHAISNSSTFAVTNPSVVGLPSSAQWRSDNRSLYNLQTAASIPRSVPSLLNVFRHYATSSGTAVLHLPHEVLVLSALLAPFLISEISGGIVEERLNAVEAFEVAVRTWKAETNELSVERCLWCCKVAAASPNPLRMRVLGILWAIILPRDSSFKASTSATFQSLIKGLFQLLHVVAAQSEHGSEQEEIRMVKQLISQVHSGSSGEMDRTSVEEEYGVSYGRSEDHQSVRQAIVLESLVRCMENGPEKNCRWILQNTLEEYWPLPQQPLSYTPLLTALKVRTLETFSRAAVSLLRSKSADTATRRHDAETIVRIFRSRVVPEAETISGQGVAETRARTIRVILELFNADHPGDSQLWGMALFSHWYQVREWKTSFESTLKDLIQNNNWYIVLRILTPLTQALPDEFRKSVIVFVLPLLHEHLVVDPPPHPCPLLTDFFNAISRWHPDVFYKPLVTCTATLKELTVVNQLCVITAVSKFFPDFWMCDLEMITTVLMFDVGGRGKGKSTSKVSPVWGTARLGQSALILEVIGCVQGLRQSTENTISSPVSLERMNFVNRLEARLSFLLEAKEAKTLVPPSQRLLFCMLLLQIRLLTRSLKPVAWFTRVVSWFFQYWSDAKTSFDLEVEDSANQLRSMYSAAQQAAHSFHKGRNTMLLSPTSETGFVTSTGPSAAVPTSYDKQLELVTLYSRGFAATALELFVTLSGLLTSDDYRRLGPLLWNECLDSSDTRIIPSVCFLTMQCAEKDRNFLNLVEYDLKSPKAALNLRAIRNFSLLFNWRFQILSQRVITDRARRKPFILARDPLPFVATDVGSHLFIPIEDLNDTNDNLPLELRRQLTDIGWTEGDEPANQQLEWLQTPLSLLPIHQLDRLGATSEQPALLPPSPSLSPTPSPTKSPGSDDGQDTKMLRQTSTSGSAVNVKKRAVFVPALAALLPCLASLVFNSDFIVANAARGVIMDLMRNDPVLLTRPICDLLADDKNDITIAIQTLRAFLHVRCMLPPAMTHHVFNDLAGYLKYIARRSDIPEIFRQFALSIPTLSKFGTQVSDMSTREIRRAKMEVFLIPSGSLWFPPSAPAGPMFPRALGTINNPFDAAPVHLVLMSIIRLSQNMFFLAMLRRNPQDVQIVRKHMSSLVLPSRENQYDSGPLGSSDFVPRKPGSRQIERLPLDIGLNSLSLMLSRSYLLVIAQIFRSMSRHLSDRTELAVHIDGLKRILLAHGDDIGIVTHAMIALMVASTRFRRLFASGGGFTLFMQALFKTYAEAENHSGIRHAIVYAVHRFFAQHGENFVFQSIDTLAQIITLSGVDGNWIAKNIFSLFSTLKLPLSTSAPDAAGIRNVNKEQEREALIVRTAEERPQTYLNSLRQGGSNGNGVVVATPPEEYEARPLRSDEFIKLFLTVIAHDPSILRAQQFLRLFRFLTPFFYNASGSARSVLRDGIDALGLVLLKARSSEQSSTRHPGDGNLASHPSQAMLLETQVQDNSKSASDLSSMRMDYLSAVVAFVESGGQLQPTSSGRVIDIVKSVLKDSGEDRNESISSFFTEYAKASLLRPDHSSPRDFLLFLGELATYVPQHVSNININLSGVFDVVSELTSNPHFANEPQFAQVVVTQLCGSTLSACESATSDRPFSSSPVRLSLVSLMAKAMFLRGANVMAEVERIPISIDFLAGFVLPLTLTLKSPVDIASDNLQMEPRHRIMLAKTWVRLLSYVMSACRKATAADERTKSHDKHNSSSHKAQTQLRTIVMQVMKVIIIRAENDLSSNLPGIWCRVASFLDTLIGQGSGTFAIPSQENYFASSPSQSPRTSVAPFGSPFSDRDFYPSKQGYRSPRLVDYSMWSLFELLCQIRHPLLLQMRLSMRMKVAALDQVLHSSHNHVPSPYGSRRVSSIFSKPRLRMSASLSSPESSYPLSTSPSMQSSPGFRQFPSPSVTAQDSSSYGQRVFHSGLVESPTLSSTRKSGESGDSGTRPRPRPPPIVRSYSLVRATYRRIRFVQSCMGYEFLLLPLPEVELESDGEILATTWTRKQALDVIVQETKELMEEFRESVAAEDNTNDGILVDPNQSLAI